MGKMTKIDIFCDFEQNYPLEMTPVKPAGRYINLKTIEKVFRDPYIVSEVHWQYLDMDWGSITMSNMR